MKAIIKQFFLHVVGQRFFQSAKSYKKNKIKFIPKNKDLVGILRRNPTNDS
jgi:hypothetical protein